MKQKGFTLVELLGVIVILGLLVTIVFPSITGIIAGAKKTSNESQKKLIISSAKIWVSDNDTKLSDNIGALYNLKVADMVSGGYLKDTDIINLETDEEMSNACVIIKTNKNNYDYTFKEDCSEEE